MSVLEERRNGERCGYYGPSLCLFAFLKLEWQRGDKRSIYSRWLAFEKADELLIILLGRQL